MQSVLRFFARNFVLRSTNMPWSTWKRLVKKKKMTLFFSYGNCLTIIDYWPLWTPVIGRDTVSAQAPVLGPYKKNWLFHRLPRTVHGGQHDTKNVTFELLLHEAFVADENWGFSLCLNQLVIKKTGSAQNFNWTGKFAKLRDTTSICKTCREAAYYYTPYIPVQCVKACHIRYMSNYHWYNRRQHWQRKHEHMGGVSCALRKTSLDGLREPC